MLLLSACAARRPLYPPRPPPRQYELAYVPIQAVAPRYTRAEMRQIRRTRYGSDEFVAVAPTPPPDPVPAAPPLPPPPGEYALAPMVMRVEMVPRWVPVPELPAPPAPVFPLTPGHFLFAAEIGLDVFQSSEYGRQTRVWGYGGFNTGGNVATRFEVSVHRFLMLGARLGHTWANSGTAHADGSRIALAAWDVSAVASLVPLLFHMEHGTLFFMTLDAEFGASVASLGLRDAAISTTLPRFFAGLSLHFASRYIGFSVSAGWQYLLWPDAGGPNVNLDLSGLVVLLALEHLN